MTYHTIASRQMEIIRLQREPQTIERDEEIDRIELWITTRRARNTRNMQKWRGQGATPGTLGHLRASQRKIKKYEGQIAARRDAIELEELGAAEHPTLADEYAYRVVQHQAAIKRIYALIAAVEAEIAEMTDADSAE